MRKKCPQCGQGLLFKRWNKLHDNCSVCGLKYLENQGDLWGYLVFLDRALFLFPFVVVVYFKLNNPDSAWLYVVGGALGFALLYTLPHRTGMSLAVDYLIRRKSGELPDQKS